MRIHLPTFIRPTASRIELAGIFPRQRGMARISSDRGAFRLRKRFAPAVVVTTSVCTRPDVNTGKCKSIWPLPLTMTFSGVARLQRAEDSGARAARSGGRASMLGVSDGRESKQTDDCKAKFLHGKISFGKA